MDAQLDGRYHESRSFVELMEKVRPPRWTGWPLQVAGDKGYSYTPIRSWLERRIVEQVIPQRSDQIRREGRVPLDRRAYKKRARVEQCVGWLKENRAWAPATTSSPPASCLREPRHHPTLSASARP